jgi:hypothetical protein
MISTLLLAISAATSPTWQTWKEPADEQPLKVVQYLDLG